MAEPLHSLGADDEWDAGSMGCGELVIELRVRVRALAPGQVLRLVAQDPGAVEDIPAWCGLTGHALVRAVHPVYWIRRKEN
jgi:tRNA 2-thiouridine synthesizing protein A